MNPLITHKKVALKEHHIRPGRTRHTICGRDFPPFVSLEIVQYPNNSGYFLLHIAAGGEVADTWHQSIDDALHQAEYEFGVQKSEWIDLSAD